MTKDQQAALYCRYGHKLKPIDKSLVLGPLCWWCKQCRESYANDEALTRLPWKK